MPEPGVSVWETPSIGTTTPLMMFGMQKTLGMIIEEIA